MNITITKPIFLIIISFLFSISLSGQSFEIDNLKYSVNNDETSVSVTGHSFTITNSNINLTDVVIPEQVVNEGITYSVTKIGNSAFKNFSNLKSVTFPESITEIDHYAFQGCSFVVELELPESLVSVGAGAFASMRRLKTIRLPESIKKFYGAVFDCCKELTEVSLPSGLKVVPLNTFFRCDNLTTVSLPADVEYVHPEFAHECSSMKNVFIDDKNLKYKNIDGALYDKSGDSLLYMPALNEKMSIAEGTKVITEKAFINCTTMTDLNIPASVIKISDSSFSDCRNLINIFVNKNNSVFTDLKGVLYSKDQTIIYVYPRKKEGKYSIYDKVTKINGYAFYGATLLEEIEIPSSTISIGSAAFHYCKSLKNVILPDNITSIGANAFKQCSGLEKIVLPKNLSSVAVQMFQYCENLCEVVYPENLKKIEHDAFYQCESLVSVNIPEGTTLIDYRAFKGCTALKTLILPSTLKTIGTSAFDNMTSLEEVYCYNPDPVTYSDKQFFIASDISKAQLYIPYGSGTAYGKDICWSGFGKITEMENVEITSLNSLTGEQTSVYVSGGYIHIENISSEVNIYDITGQLIENVSGDKSEARIKLPKRGVYIVKGNKYSGKIIY